MNDRFVKGDPGQRGVALDEQSPDVGGLSGWVFNRARLS